MRRTHGPSSKGNLERIGGASDRGTKQNVVVVLGAAGRVSTDRARCHAVRPVLHNTVYVTVKRSNAYEYNAQTLLFLNVRKNLRIFICAYKKNLINATTEKSSSVGKSTLSKN